ncbi:MAG TPA: lactate utilization protein [bacterium]|nr:lactate utilization protein [bacterium]
MSILLEAQKALEANNFTCIVFANREEAKTWILQQIPPGSTIGTGGSMTIEKDLNLHSDLDQIGTFLSPYRAGLSAEAAQEIRKQSFWVDYYLTSSNAITLEGELVNTDGSGNRIASIALQFGPARVFVVVGRNKIVADRAAAFERIRTIAAPLNVKRLRRQTGCDQTGFCIDCKSPDRICANTLITCWQKDRNRITVVLIDEDLGF